MNRNSSFAKEIERASTRILNGIPRTAPAGHGAGPVRTAFFDAGVLIIRDDAAPGPVADIVMLMVMSTTIVMAAVSWLCAQAFRPIEV